MNKYDKNSLKAEEFINDGEILDSLKFADENKNNLELVDKIIEKARLKKGINHREASVLLACEDKERIKEIYNLARQIKKDFYGDRIVMFAPLYLSNYCVNGCVYCPYHAKNKHICRKKLTQDEVRKEVIALQDMGHKRLAIEAGEDPVNNPIEYILDCIKTIYSVNHKNGAMKIIKSSRKQESAHTFFFRKPTIKRVMNSSIPQVPSTTTITTPRQWTEPCRAVLMMWESVCFSGLSSTAMNLQDFLCTQNILRLFTVSVRTQSAFPESRRQTI